MTGFEYKVVPAPTRGLKAKGVKGTPARFANALEQVMNDLGATGWEYQRTDTLPVEERVGLTGKTTTFQNMLVFRRALDPQTDAPAEVAALIEDQTYVLSEQEAAIEDTIEETPAPTEKPAVDPTTPEQKATDDIKVDVEARPASTPNERVTQTLTAPVVFPWNKRRAAAAPANSDTDKNRPDDNIPAE